MRRMCARKALFVLPLLCLLGFGAVAGDIGFSGGVGLDITYTPIPPASYNIGSDLTLGFSIAGFSFASATGFDLSGFLSEIVTMSVDLGAVQIAEEIRFEPFFSWNELNVDISIVGVNVGIDLILAEIVGPQTPTYSVGAVFEFSSEILCGFSIMSLTGFGANDLINILGGIRAPFSERLLYSFRHIDGICNPVASLDVSILPGFYFEEELFRIEIDTMGMIASNTTWFDATGLAELVFEMGYSFAEPSLSMLFGMRLDGSFVITGMDFILDLQIDVVRFTSHTTFAQVPPPSLIPIVFDGQDFAVAFELCGVEITTVTSFDGSFFFEGFEIGIEAVLDPVTFRSLTTFDAFGFSGQCIYADVQFCGVQLFTKAEFDFTGIQLITVGFELTFGN